MLRDTSVTDCSHQTGDIDGPADPSVLLNTMAVNLKVCRELLQQAQASLDRVEARRGWGHRACSAPGPSHCAADCAVAPPSSQYSLFRLLPENSEWAKNLERQLCTGIYELLPKEQLAAALTFLDEGPTEECTLYQSAEGPTQGPSLHQSAEGPTQGPILHQSVGHLSVELTTVPTLYQSALDLSPSKNAQEQQLSGGAQAQDLTDCSKTTDQSDRVTGAILNQTCACVYAGCPGESSDEGPPSPPQPTIGLLHMEVGDLSSITHSPPHHQKILSLLFKRHLTPCNSTPRSTGAQTIFDSCPLVSSPYTSQNFCTAVDESANLSYQQPNCNPAVRKAVREQNQGEGDLKTGMKRTQDHLLFESAGTAEGEVQGTGEGECERTAERETQGTAEREAQRTAEGKTQAKVQAKPEGTAEGEFGGTAKGHSEGTAVGESQERAEGKTQGTAEGEFGGTAEGESAETAEGDSEETAEGESEETAEGESEGTAEGEAQEGETNTKDWELAQCHQLYVSHMDTRTHFTLNNVLDCTEEQDSALVYKVSSRSESREGSVESPPSTPPSEDCCSPHGQGEPQWASLLDNCRAHSTLDDILQTHIRD